MKIIVIGGGYAGLGVIIEVRKHLPEADIILFDPATFHLKVTRLHQTARYPLENLQKPFDTLAERYQFEWIPAAVSITEDTLSDWQQHKALICNSQRYEFDYLVIATGTKPRALPIAEHVHDLESLRQHGLANLLHDWQQRVHGEMLPAISIVGGGPSGVQFLFEIHDWLKRQQQLAELRLITSDEHLLPQLPPAFHRYAKQRMIAMDRVFLPGSRYENQQDNNLFITHTDSGDQQLMTSHLTLLLPGTASASLHTNRYGQILHGHRSLRHIYAAGDCSNFPNGLNNQSAQAAVRKARQVARNIVRAAHGDWPQMYTHINRGCFVGLGPMDGIGWMGLKSHILHGLPAFVVSELLETQYDLFVTGIDTYL